MKKMKKYEYNYAIKKNNVNLQLKYPLSNCSLDNLFTSSLGIP